MKKNINLTLLTRFSLNDLNPCRNQKNKYLSKPWRRLENIWNWESISIWIINYKENRESNILAGNFMFKVKNRNTRPRYEVCSKLTIKTPERRRSIYFPPCSSVSIVNFEQVNAGWDCNTYMSMIKVTLNFL